MSFCVRLPASRRRVTGRRHARRSTTSRAAHRRRGVRVGQRTVSSPAGFSSDCSVSDCVRRAQAQVSTLGVGRAARLRQRRRVAQQRSRACGCPSRGQRYTGKGSRPYRLATGGSRRPDIALSAASKAAQVGVAHSHQHRAEFAR
ncbi:hypothetical protein TcBrA4_0126040 [Trypanosoma cruzi]|nr:hypothetical protein TcBrA4_0126040 [Trypanosoma cruzi]